MSSKIIVHCLVKNEENFIWYALNSVLPYVDKILVWDTGSTDKTIEIIKTIKSSKISFKQVSSVTLNDFPKLRQKMLDATSSTYTWLLLLDGDEIWPKKSIKLATEFVRSHSQYETVIVRTHNLVGDIYHRLPERDGHYQFADKKGHLALRFINLKKIPGLHVALPYGQEGYFDQSNRLIQERDPKKMKFLDLYYHHATHLQRSSKDHKTLKRSFKLKYQLGESIPRSEVPEVFFQNPTQVTNVTKPRTKAFIFKSISLTPLRTIKRLFVTHQSGY